MARQTAVQPGPVCPCKTVIISMYSTFDDYTNYRVQSPVHTHNKGLSCWFNTCKCLLGACSRYLHEGTFYHIQGTRVFHFIQSSLFRVFNNVLVYPLNKEVEKKKITIENHAQGVCSFSLIGPEKGTPFIKCKLRM